MTTEGPPPATAALTVPDFGVLARERLPEPVWHYLDGGGGDEISLRANEAAYDRIGLRPRVMVDVSHCDLSGELLGSDLALPIGVAPTAYHELVTPEGELATARAAGSLGALMVVSVFASRPLEQIAASASGPLWLQLYWLRRRDAMAELIGRAEAAGCAALVLTVDTPRLGRRYRELRYGFALPPHLAAATNIGGDETGTLHESVPGSSALGRHAGVTMDPSLSWDDLGWLRSVTTLPVLLKGVLTAEDAALAVAHGVAGLIVSNHGGRQLDGVPATVEALPEVASAVAGACPVILDGGIRRGTDVLKALALGADAVLVGRPVLWGLAVDGEAGARQVLTLLRDELSDAMALSGRPRLSAVDGSAICEATWLTRSGMSRPAAGGIGPRHHETGRDRSEAPRDWEGKTMSIDAFVIDDKDLLPTDEEVRSYQERGWYLSRKLLTDDEVDAMVAASERFYAGARDRTLPARPPRLAYWDPAMGDVQRHNDYIFYEDETIRRILSKPIIAAVAARLAATPEIRLWNTTLIYKPPVAGEVSNIVPWHFDRHYWQTCTSDNMLTAFIPFHDCDEEMGTITMVDGSHLWEEVSANDSSTRHFADRDRAELDEMLAENARYNNTEIRKIPMIIPKGHMSFHHCRIYHGSGPNRSDRPRRAISLHLQDADNRWRDFRISTGEQVAYNNDVLVRKTTAGHPDYADPEFCPVLWANDR